MSIISQLTTIAASGGGAPESYWVANVLGTTSAYQNFMNAGPLRDGTDVFAFLRTQGTDATTNYSSTLIKFDKDGALTSQRTFTTPVSGFGRKIGQKSSGDLVITTRIEPVDYEQVGLVVPSTLGASTANFGTTGNTNNKFASTCVVDSSNNTYLVGYEDYYTGSAFTNVYLIDKYDSGNNLTYTKRYYSSLSNIRNCAPYDVIEDSSGDIVIAGKIATNARTSDTAHLLKLTSSGVVSFGKSLYQSNSTSSRSYYFGVAEDASGNYYAIGYLRDYSGAIGSGEYMGLIVKYNSAGTVLWYRGLGDTGFNTYLYGAAIDSAGNIVFSGQTTTNLGLIGSLDTNGNQNYLLSFTRSGKDALAGTALQVDSTDSILVGAQCRDTTTLKYEADVYKLPADGSITGTFGSYTIATSSITLRTSIGTIVEETPTMGIQNTGLTKQTYTISENTVSFPNSTTAIA